MRMKKIKSNKMNRAAQVCDLIPSQTLSKYLNSLVTKAIGKKYFPAAGLGVVRLVQENGQEKIQMGVAAGGVRVVHSDLTVGIHDKFLLGPCSRPLSALLLQTLMNKDPSFSWNTTIGDKIPHAPPSWKGITVRELASQTAGIEDMFLLTNTPPDSSPLSRAVKLLRISCSSILRGKHTTTKKIFGQYLFDQMQLKDTQRDERVKITRHARLEELMGKADPVELYKGHYRKSVIMPSFASYLAEIHFGKSYESLLEEYIKEPLGLESLGFGIPQGLQEDSSKVIQPWGHINTSFLGVNTEAVPPEDSTTPEIFYPSLGIHMSTLDFTKSLGAQLILSREAETADSILFKDQTNMKNDSMGFSAGWIVLPMPIVEDATPSSALSILNASDATFEQTGASDQWTSVCFISPKYGLAVGVLSNSFHFKAFYETQKLLYKAREMAMTISQTD